MDPTTTPTRNPHIVSPTPIEAWNDDVLQAADLLKATSISTPRGRSVTLDIPLDDDNTDDLISPPHPKAQRPAQQPSHTVYRRRSPIRRDSQNRRNALLKGKEGSRRRQRWENDRLLSNPHAQPPLPSDWEVRPNPNAQNVPYFLAPLWDTEFARRAAKRKAEAAQPALSREEAAAQKVKRELRAKLKRAAGAKGLLQDLEEEVRVFVVQWEGKQRQLEEEGVIAESSSSSSSSEEADSEDEEIVFVGRNGAMSDEKEKGKGKRREQRAGTTLEKDKLIFQSLVDDHGASFGRYLVHAIAIYYGLKTWSVSTTDGRREAYVGLKEDPLTRRPSLLKSELPRPLWAVV